MGQVLHPVTDAIGLTDYAGQARAEEAAAEATQQSLDMTKEQLDFQKQQYEDWKDIYGTMQEQEADYIAKYTGADVVAQQLGQTSKEFKDAETQLTRSLAQRGLSGSGAEAAGLTSLAAQQAATNASIRSSQDDIASMKRQQFLGLGLGQGTQMLATQAGVAQTGIGAQASIAGQQTALSGQLGASSMAGMGGLFQAAGSVAGGYLAAGN